MNSVEKLQRIMNDVDGQVAAGEGNAQMLGALRMVLPMVVPFIPSDPDELDGLLLMGARWGLDLVSDECPLDVSGAVAALDELGGEAATEGTGEEVTTG